MPIIRFESDPPDVIYEVESASSFMAAVFDAQLGVSPEANSRGAVCCLVACGVDFEEWVSVDRLDLSIPLSHAEIYKQWPRVYNRAKRSRQPVLTLVQ